MEKWKYLPLPKFYGIKHQNFLAFLILFDCSGDGAGNIEGEYTVALPDGRIQHVTYHADGGYGGTVMEVTYKGEAHHPEHLGPAVASHGGHGGVLGRF